MIPGGSCFVVFDCGSQIATGLARDTAGAVLSFFASALVDGAAWIVGKAVHAALATTDPALGAHWFQRELGLMMSVAKVVLLPLLLVASIGPVLRQDLRALTRVWAVGLPVSLLAGLGAAAFANLALQATDALCTAIVGKSPIGAISAAVGVGLIEHAPAVLSLVEGFLLLAGGLLLWLELMVREAAVYIAVFFAPLCLACFVWPATASVAKKSVQLLAALIVSKFVIVGSLVLGSAALAAGSGSSVLTGIAIVLMAALAPFALLRLVPLVEVAAIAHLEGMARRPLRAAGNVAANLGGPAPIARTLLARAGGGADPVASAGVAPQPIPERAPDYLPGRHTPGDGDG